MFRVQRYSDPEDILRILEELRKEEEEGAVHDSHDEFMEGTDLDDSDFDQEEVEVENLAKKVFIVVQNVL